MTTSPVDRTQIEPWVDAAAIGAHLGFKQDHIRVLARKGVLPGRLFRNGKREFWRFKISEVDAALQATGVPA